MDYGIDGLTDVIMPAIDFTIIIDIFSELILGIVRIVTDILLTILPYGLIVLGVYIAINVGYRLISTIPLEGLAREAAVRGAVEANVELNDGIPEPPLGWMSSDEDWDERWVKENNNVLFERERRRLRDEDWW
jgi:hypothetical protein